jgi:hypothetical protein
VPEVIERKENSLSQPPRI